MMSDELVSPEAADARHAQEMSHLSVEERGRVYEELHGVDPELEEANVEERLQDFCLEMESQVAQDQAPYIARAMNSAPSYIMGLRLQMLRADYFDPHKAVQRLERFLRGKVAYYGEDTLTRPVYLSDLNSDDQRMMESGFYQLLPQRDRAGRAVIVFFDLGESFDPKYLINVVREPTPKFEPNLVPSS